MVSIEIAFAVLVVVGAALLVTGFFIGQRYALRDRED